MCSYVPASFGSSGSNILSGTAGPGYTSHSDWPAQALLQIGQSIVSVFALRGGSMTPSLHSLVILA